MFLVVGSIERLIEPLPVAYGWVGLAVMGLSIVATAVLIPVRKMVVRRTGLIAIGADRLHYTGDLLTNAGVIVGIALATYFGIGIADPLIGILVAGILAWWHALRTRAAGMRSFIRIHLETVAELDQS